MGLNISLGRLTGRDDMGCLEMEWLEDQFDTARYGGDKEFIYDNSWEYLGEPGYAGYLQRPSNFKEINEWVASNDCDKARLSAVLTLLEANSDLWFHVS